MKLYDRLLIAATVFVLFCLLTYMPTGSLDAAITKAAPSLLVLGVGIGLYLLPTIIATIRHHHNNVAIFVVNLFLGWTFLGWVGALAWSFTKCERAGS